MFNHICFVKSFLAVRAGVGATILFMRDKLVKWTIPRSQWSLSQESEQSGGNNHLYNSDSSNSLKSKYTHKAMNVSFTQSKVDFWMCIHFIIEELPCDSITGARFSFSNLLKTWTRKGSCSGETIWPLRSLDWPTETNAWGHLILCWTYCAHIS